MTKRSAQRRKRYRDNPALFIQECVSIFNATNERWEPFALWPAQSEVLGTMHHDQRVVILKARQLGLTWLSLAYALWAMLFKPAATVGIFSRREVDAKDLLNFRLKGMHDRLPAWAHAQPGPENNSTRWSLANGSSAMAFPTNGGRQYTFSLVMVDEADFQPDLPDLLAAVEPTVDAGGRLWLLSSVDKATPMSRFKAIYRAAAAGDNQWAGVFLPWSARPQRDAAWYDEQAADTLANTGSLDDLHQEYPATDAEALAPRSLDKRLPHEWLTNCYDAMKPRTDAELVLPGLSVYHKPEAGHYYVVGVDTAEGNPTSDESAITVLDMLTGEEVAVCAGRFQPSTTGEYADKIGTYYNRAGLLVERNNHGHAVLLWLRDNSALQRLTGKDGHPGWLTNSLGKALLYSEFADAIRDRQVRIHGLETYSQLASIDGSTLSAPDGMHDDHAMSFVLAHMGRAGMANAPLNQLAGMFKHW